MQYDCESLLRFIITNILTINSLAILKSTRSCAVRSRKFTLSRLHISLSAGIIVILLHKTLLSNSLPMRFPANKPKQRHIPSNRLGFLTTEPKRTARDGMSNTGWGLRKMGNMNLERKEELPKAYRKIITKPPPAPHYHTQGGLV